VGGDVTLQPTAVVEQDVFTLGGNVNRMSGAQVNGQVRSGWPTNIDFSGWNPTGWRWDGWNGPNWTANLGGFAANFLAVLLAVLAVVLLPKNVQRVRESIVAAPWASLGVGFLALIVVAVVGGLLIITICLALFGGLLLLAAWIAGMLGLAALGLELGERLLRAFGAKIFAPALAVLLGAFVLVLLTYLPCCIGALIWVALASASLGAAILSRFGSKVYTPSAGAPAAGTRTPAA
jgi:hypothetical protein